MPAVHAAVRAPMHPWPATSPLIQSFGLARHGGGIRRPAYFALGAAQSLRIVQSVVVCAMARAVYVCAYCSYHRGPTANFSRLAGCLSKSLQGGAKRSSFTQCQLANGRDGDSVCACY